jgi:hypothetical protein
LDKVSELCDGWIGRDGSINHKAASVPVDAVTRSPPIKKHTTTRTDDPPTPTAPPSGPPRSGWVQQVAGANAGWRCQFRFAGDGFWPGVAQLFSLGSKRAGFISELACAAMVLVVRFDL